MEIVEVYVGIGGKFSYFSSPGSSLPVLKKTLTYLLQTSRYRDWEEHAKISSMSAC